MKGTKIEFLRNLRGYNQEYVAKKSEIEISKYKRIEANAERATEVDLKNIATVLGTTVEDIKSPNPFIMVNIDNSPNSLGNGTYNNLIQQETISLLMKKDEQLDKIILLVSNKDKVIENLVADFKSIVESFIKYKG